MNLAQRVTNIHQSGFAASAQKVGRCASDHTGNAHFFAFLSDVVIHRRAILHGVGRDVAFKRKPFAGQRVKLHAANAGALASNVEQQGNEAHRAASAGGVVIM